VDDRKPTTVDESPRLARRAFGLSMIWPALFLAIRLDLFWVPGLSGVSRLIIFVVLALIGSIGAIKTGRKVVREGRPGADLAKTAVVLGWIELVLTILAGGALAVLLYAFAHSDWTF
jgi:hypothetical protein